MDKPSPNCPKPEESWTSSLFSKILGPSTPGQSGLGKSTASQVPEGSAGSTPTGSQPSASALKPIRPHERTPSHSHPELAFSPTDIGIWEVDNTRKPGTKPPSEGFSNWGQWFGSGK